MSIFSAPKAPQPAAVPTFEDVSDPNAAADEEERRRRAGRGTQTKVAGGLLNQGQKDPGKAASTTLGLS